MAELIIRSGKHQGKKLTLPPEGLVVGRDKSCQIRLASTDVSRKHCSIRPTPDGVVVRDLGSRNGTFINDSPVKEDTLLESGDMLTIGPMKFQAPGEKETPKPPEPEERPFSEDDIAGWLTDDSDVGEEDVAGSDTTIIKLDQAAKLGSGSAILPAKKQFKSVADEAADVIRRHWKTVEEEQDE